jgi:ABC-type uncharacterized transport system substrate-binding protein
MRRREFIAALGGTAAWPLVVRAQPALPLVVYLSTGLPNKNTHLVNAFLRGLRDMGYVQDQNVRIEYRWAENQYDRLPALARDLVERRVAAIYAPGLVSALAAKEATTAIPIVFGVGADPVKAGLVASFNRPGTNLTGMADLIEALGPKRLEVLRELLPNVTTIGVVANISNPTAAAQTREILESPRTNTQQIKVGNVTGKNDIEEAFAALIRDNVGGLIVVPDPILINSSDQIVRLAAQYALPTVYPLREFTEAGGLASYGTNFAESTRQSGVYVGKILKGAQPADLPVMQAVKLELVLNLKTAKTLGLTVPPTLLARADEVIE